MINDYTVALFGHILGVLIFVSGIVLAGVPFEIARRRTSPVEIATILGLARAGVPLVGTGALMLLGFGLWLVDVSGFDFSAGWIQAALGLFVAAMALGAVGGHRPKRARLHAAKLATDNQPGDAELRALLDDPVSRGINYASAAAILAILVLMVFKP
jgi:uncharacterized membrane protein